MKNLKEAFGFRLKELRKSKKYTQEALAEKIDLSPRQLIRIENGENFPSVETIGKISIVLGVELDSLFDFRWNEDLIGIQNKPSLRVVKKHGEIYIKPLNSQNIEHLILNKPLKTNEYESIIFDFCKKNNKPLTVEFFENEQRISVKTFYPDKIIEEIMSSDDIVRHELNNYILARLKKISSDSKKLNYIKLAFDSLEDKKALGKLKTLIQGIELAL